MATLPESVDYTDKDFDALRARLIALIKSVFPDWTDFDAVSYTHLDVYKRQVVKKLKGFQTLTIEGQATSVLMNREAKTRSWANKSRADVVREIAAEHGYEGEFLDVEDTGEVLDTISQSAETDARFLRRLAAREEYRCV